MCQILILGQSIPIRMKSYPSFIPHMYQSYVSLYSDLFFNGDIVIHPSRRASLMEISSLYLTILKK
jgi:hypothetical protein